MQHVEAPPVEVDSPESASSIQTMEVRVKFVGEATECSHLDTMTRGDCGDSLTNAATVIANSPKRKTFWKRVKRFARRILCCGVRDVDPDDLQRSKLN